ncbi:MAG: hypothetical protein M5U26_19810 [Planctomycetota bacterium]|nr:hypothetical protein [Planctomycetota bacterium]
MTLTTRAGNTFSHRFHHPILGKTVARGLGTDDEARATCIIADIKSICKDRRLLENPRADDLRGYERRAIECVFGKERTQKLLGDGIEGIARLGRKLVDHLGLDAADKAFGKVDAQGILDNSRPKAPMVLPAKFKDAGKGFRNKQAPKTPPALGFSRARVARYLRDEFSKERVAKCLRDELSDPARRKVLFSTFGPKFRIDATAKALEALTAAFCEAVMAEAPRIVQDMDQKLQAARKDAAYYRRAFELLSQETKELRAATNAHVKVS